jgi:hypothetical protein
VDSDKEKGIARLDPTEIEALIMLVMQSGHNPKKENTGLIEKPPRTFASPVGLPLP